MSRNLGIAGIQMTVVRGEDNSDTMLAKMKFVSLLFPWVDIIFFSELCLSGVDIRWPCLIPTESWLNSPGAPRRKKSG